LPYEPFVVVGAKSMEFFIILKRVCITCWNIQWRRVRMFRS